MKTAIHAFVWTLLALCLCSCDHEGGGQYNPAPVVVASLEYAPTTEYEVGLMGYDLAVIVQSNSGLPLAGAWVQIVLDDGMGEVVLEANADEWGRAYFYFYTQPNSWVYIDACSTGFACSAVDLLTGGVSEIDAPMYLAPLVVEFLP